MRATLVLGKGAHEIKVECHCLHVPSEPRTRWFPGVPAHFEFHNFVVLTFNGRRLSAEWAELAAEIIDSQAGGEVYEQLMESVSRAVAE